MILSSINVSLDFRSTERKYHYMQPADFGPDAAGRVVRAPEGYWTFIPAPLPPALEPSWDLFSRLSDADRALSELAGRAANLPNPHLLIAPFLRREAVLSSRIEGTQASLSDLFFFEAGSPSARSATRRVPDDVQEVANYVRALEYGLKRTATLPISLRLIREIHGRLMKGVRGDHLMPGRVPAHAELDRPRRLHADGRHVCAAAGPGHASRARPLREVSSPEADAAPARTPGARTLSVRDHPSVRRWQRPRGTPADSAPPLPREAAAPTSSVPQRLFRASPDGVLPPSPDGQPDRIVGGLGRVTFSPALRIRRAMPSRGVPA